LRCSGCLFSDGLSRGRVLHNNGLLAADAVGVAGDELLAQAVSMEHALVVAAAGEPDDVGAGPDALEANRAVVILARLEEHRAVGHSADQLGDPDVLPGVASAATNHREKEHRHEEVNSDDDHESVKDEAEDIADARVKASILTLLSSRQVIIRVESVVHQVEEEYEGVEDNDHHNDEGCVLIVSPVAVGVLDATK